MNHYIPIIHARIHAKLVEKASGNIVGYGFIKEWVRRMVIRIGGISAMDLHPTIVDLEKLGLITKVSRIKFKINNYKDKRLKNIIF